MVIAMQAFADAGLLMLVLPCIEVGLLLSECSFVLILQSNEAWLEV